MKYQRFFEEKRVEPKADFLHLEPQKEDSFGLEEQALLFEQQRAKFVLAVEQEAGRIFSLLVPKRSLRPRQFSLRLRPEQHPSPSCPATLPYPPGLWQRRWPFASLIVAVEVGAWIIREVYQKGLLFRSGKVVYRKS
jgi:hypothetical protein